MKKILILLILSLVIMTVAEGQDNPARVDTTAMPRLEIPEITIVGKKAITLPFARKGEIYDIDIYEVSPPDTSILESRPAMSFPIGSLPRYEEPLIPWHVSAEGSFGSFSTGHLRAYVDYKGKRWASMEMAVFRQRTDTLFMLQEILSIWMRMLIHWFQLTMIF